MNTTFPENVSSEGTETFQRYGTSSYRAMPRSQVCGKFADYLVMCYCTPTLPFATAVFQSLSKTSKQAGR